MYIEITPTNNIVTFRYQTTPDYDSEVIDFTQLKQDLVVTLKYENGAWIASHNYNQIATAIAEGVLVRLTDETNSRYAIMGEYSEGKYTLIASDGSIGYAYVVTSQNEWSLTTFDLEGRIYGTTIDESVATSVENGRYVRFTWTASNNYRSYFFQRSDIKRVRCSLYGGGGTDVSISAYTSTSEISADTCMLQVFVSATGSGNVGTYDIYIPEGAVLVVISNRSQYGTPTISLDTRGDLPVVPESIDIKSILTIADRGYINTDGSITPATSYAVTEMIPVETLDKFLVSAYLSTSYVMMYGYFNEEGTQGVPLYKGLGSQVVDNAMYVYDPRVRYVRLCSRASSSDTVSFVQMVKSSVEEITGELESNSNVSHTIPFFSKSQRLNADGTTTDNSAYNSTDFIPVKEGDVLLYTGYLGSTATAMCGYSGNTEADFEMILIPTRGAVTNKKVVIPSGISHIRASSRCQYGDVYSLTITTRAFGEILTEAMPALKNMETELSKFAGKRIAVIGDSIATGSNLNPYFRVQAGDVGNTIQSYITYFDVYNLSGTAINKTIGGVAVTEDMIGTLQSFVPAAEDIGKTLGDAVSYYNGEVSWPFFVADYLGATLINASWSGASMCSGQSQQVRTLSYAWSDLSIGRCATRDENGTTIAPDIIIICRGVNDFSHAQGSAYAVLEDYDIAANGYPASDVLPDDKYSFTRAYLLTIKKLRDAYPDAVIYCATLNVFKRVIYDRFPTRNGQYSLPDMNAKIRDIAGTMGCRVISFDNDGITFENCYPTYISDSAETPTHPNIEGQKVMAVKALNDLLVGAAGVRAYQKPSTGIPESDLSNAVATKLNATEIFWATYGTTTAAEIDAAVAAGKAVMCHYDGKDFVMNMQDSGGFIYFGGSAGTSFIFLRVKRSDSSWIYSIQAAQVTSDRLSSLATLIINGESTTKYPSAKATFDGLGKKGVVSQTQTWSGTGGNPRTYVMSDLVYGLIPQANIDLFTAAGATFNATTGYFELNGLTDISYEEMRAIYEAPHITTSAASYNGRYLCKGGVRTALPFVVTTNAPAEYAASGSFAVMFYNTNMEVIIFGVNNNGINDSMRSSSIESAFSNCYRLRSIKRLVLLSSATTTSAFHNCYSLEQVEIKKLAKDVSFSSSSLINLASIVYMVDNAANTSAITITLHATAYARCQADTTEYTYGGQTYTGILAYASARNITLASA